MTPPPLSPSPVEFDLQQYLEAMEARLTAGIDAIHTRLDLLNGRTRAAENKIAWIIGVGACAAFVIGVATAYLR